MLSFLREQSSGHLPAQKPNAAAGRKHDGTAEKPQEQEYVTVAAREKQVRKTTTLLAILFAVGLLCLWFMIKKSTPQKASAEAANTEQSQIETAIARLTGVKSEIFSRMDEIVKRFYEFSSVPQVQVYELVKNPFELETLLANLKKPGLKKNTPEIDAEMIWQQQIRQRAGNMQLLSIMQSEQGICCMIDDKILYEGDSIEGLKVYQIGDSFVKLESDGVTIVLKLSE